MKKCILFVLFVFAISNYILAQENGTLQLTLKVNAKEYKTMSLAKLGLKAHLTQDTDTEIAIQQGKTVTTTIPIQGKGLYQIPDGYKAHLLFLQPGDSISLIFNTIPNLQKRLNKGDFVVKFLKMNASSKYPGDLLFFDDWEDRVGYAIKYQVGETPMHFTARCDSAYNIGKKLLATYAAKGLISSEFSRYAMAEMQACYILNLCNMLYYVSKDKVPQNCLALAQSFQFTDSAMAVSTRHYMTAASVYNMYIANTFSLGEKGNGYANLHNEFASIVNNHTGIIKDQLMAWSVTDYADKNYPGYDSIYNQFLLLCKTQAVKSKTIKKVAQLKALATINTATAQIPLAELFAKTVVENVKNEQVSFATLLSDTMPTLIDCWATWCSPCIAQMPASKAMAVKYWGKVKFIYLSFDKDELKWKKFVQQQKVRTDEYIMTNDFSSAFSKYFNMTTIPRYILISPGGNKVLNETMPPPAVTDEFETQLKKHL